MRYMILILFSLGASVFGAWAWNRLGKIEDIEEKDRLKRKYQIIGGILGAITAVIIGIIVFTIF